MKSIELPRSHEIEKTKVKYWYMEGRKMLEIAGQAWSMKQYFPKITSLDIDKKWKPDICADAEDIPVKNNIFDIVISCHFLEHVYNPEKVLRELNRILKPNGIIYFILPVVPVNRIWLDGDKYNKHQHFFNKTNIKNLLNLTGFKLISFEYRLWKVPICMENLLGNITKKGDIFFIAKKIEKVI